MDEGASDNAGLTLLRVKQKEVSQIALLEEEYIKATESYPDIKSPPCLNFLPPEVIKNILSCLDENADPIYDDDRKINESIFQDRFIRNARNYRSASLVNKTVGPWGQELLFESPVLCQMPDTYWWSTHTKPSLALFARTLLEQRDFSTKVRKLTIFVPGRTRAYMMNLDALDEGVHGKEILEQAETYIKSLQIPKKLSISWTKGLRLQYAYPLIGVILSLVSNVEHLDLVLDTEVATDDGIKFLCTCFGIRSTQAHNLAHLERIGTLSSVKSLTIRGPSPAAMTGLEFFPGIQDLRLRLEFRPNRRAGLSPTTVPKVHFRNVSRLRLDIQLVPKPLRSIVTKPEEYFGPLLAAFENLEHLDLSDGPRDNDRNYANMSAAPILLHINNPSHLLSLKLPRKVTSSAMLTATMSRFVSLVKLTTPFHAIVNKDLEGFKSLPGSLQHLVIHDSTIDTFPCVFDLLQKKAAGEASADIHKIELWFAIFFTNKSFELLRKGQMFPDIGKQAAAVGVQLTLNKLLPVWRN